MITAMKAPVKEKASFNFSVDKIKSTTFADTHVNLTSEQIWAFRIISLVVDLDFFFSQNTHIYSYHPKMICRWSAEYQSQWQTLQSLRCYVGDIELTCKEEQDPCCDSRQNDWVFPGKEISVQHMITVYKRLRVGGGEKRFNCHVFVILHYL